MKTIIKGVLDRPVSVIVTILALAVFFVTSLTSISLKLMPNMSIPVMVISAIYPGASPEEADELVGDKLAEACETLSGIKTIHTRCTEGNAAVMLQYEYGTDMDKAYNDLRAAVDAKKPSLPKEVKDPTILEIDTNASDDITLSITGNSDDVDVLEMVNDKIVPELKKISSLAQTTVKGGDEKYIRVQVKPEYMMQYGLDLSGVATAISNTNFSTPTGTADYGDQTINMSSQVKYNDLPLLEQVPITTSKGQIIHLNDIASVKYAVSDKTSLSRYKGKEDVSVGLKRKQSGSSVTLSRNVMPVLDDLRAKYPELKIEVVDDAADTILSTLKGVAKTMVEAIFLAMFIIFVFFGDIKGSLIVGSTMPISIMATIICMNLAGFALDVVTMAALIIAIGMMTDNAVVVIEMCFRRHQAGLSFKEAAYEGTRIVVNAVIGSTITTVVVYVPLATMEGLSGQMFKPLGFTIIFALLASLISAITLIPLCFSAYKPVEHREIITNRILKWLSKRYRRILRFALKWKKSVFLGAVLLLALTGYLATMLKTELYSGTDEGVVDVSITFRPNLDIAAMDDTVKGVEAFIDSTGVIKNYSTRIERDEAAASISAYKNDETKLTTQEIVDDWNLELRNFSPICEVEVSPGSSTGMGSMSQSSTQTYDVTADNLDKLKKSSAELQKKMEEVEGVLYVTSEFANSGAKADVVIDPVLAQAKGFSAKQLAGLVYNNMSGVKATDITIDNKKYEVSVRYPKGYYETISDVEEMTFTNSNGVSVPLSEVGSVRFESAPQMVYRQDGLYSDELIATMTAETRDDVVEVLDDVVDKAIEEDPNLNYLQDSMSRMMNEEFTAIAKAIFIAVFMVFFVMAVQFESIANSLLIMLCVPFAGIGSILFMLVMGIKVSMVSLMGVLMLAGIVVNNGIILLDMTIQNQDSGMDTVEALVDAGSGRLRPILMTTLTTVIAMIPVALGLSKDAMAMQGMAAVIVGGLTASTMLTLVLLPTFYLLMDRFKVKSARWREKRRVALEAKVAEQEKILKDQEVEDARVNLVFPMAGAGTRFLDNGFDCPKPLIDLNGEPFFKRAADSLLGHVNCERMVFVVLKEHIEKFGIDAKIREYYPDAKIVSLKKVLPGALMTAMEGAKAIHNEYPVIFTDCDLVFSSESLYGFYNKDDYDCAGTLLTFKSDLDRYSYVETEEWTDKNGNTVNIAKTTAEKKVISERAITGAYGFINTSVFLRSAEKYIRNCPYDECFMSGVYNEMIAQGMRIRVFDSDMHISFGTPDEYEAAKKLLAEASEEKRDTTDEAEPEEKNGTEPDKLNADNNEEQKTEQKTEKKAEQKTEKKTEQKAEKKTEKKADKKAEKKAEKNE